MPFFPIMVRMASQDPVLTDLAPVEAVQSPAFRVMAVKVVLIRSPTKETNSSSLVIRVIRIN